MLEKELEIAVALARKAAVVILEFYALEIIEEEKFGSENFSEPVTAADRASSKLIVEGLSERFPDDAILSEEETEDAEIRLTKKRAWMIDPIDGTRGFINRDGDFGVQIGLVENGFPVIGVVLLPVENILYYAVKNEGAFIIEKAAAPRRLKISGKTDFAHFNLAVSRNHLSPKMSLVAENLNIENVVHRGSVGLKIGLITQQICDLYIHLSPFTKFWDSCAPQIILEEAGGRMTDLFGEKINYNQIDVQNRNGILASNGTSHEKIVEHLKPILSKLGRPKIKTSTD